MQVAQQFPFPTLSALATNHHRVQRDYLLFPKTNENLYIFRAFFPRNFHFPRDYRIWPEERKKENIYRDGKFDRSNNSLVLDPPLLEGKVEQEERD